MNYQFFHKLCALPYVDALWLYGSRARGEADERADIDLAIVCPEATESGWQEICGIIDEADTLLQIDFVQWDRLANDDPLSANILQDKKELYTRTTRFLLREEEEPYLCERESTDHFKALGNALERLGEILALQKTDREAIYRDAAIQRFEFCMELFWKVLKKILAKEGVEATTPRDVLRKAYQFKLIDDELLWLRMLTDRNLSSHLYQESLARAIFCRMHGYHPAMHKAYHTLSSRSFSTPPV